MKAPFTLEQQNIHPDAESLRRQYQELMGKNQREGEPKRNLLLTPFLLSIPVIIILFILISGSTSDIPNTITTEPLQREISVRKETGKVSISPTVKDSILSSKTIVVPIHK
jgi:hypothetical protein